MILLFLISLIALICIHETAHLITAKLCKCKVIKYSLGFGKFGFEIKINKTIYKITPFLLGGYCELEGELDFSKSPTAFMNLRYYKKLLIAISGCLVNIIFGILMCLLSLKINNYYLWYIGFFNLLAGMSNLIPVPGLDGSYPILVLLEKFIGKKKSIIILKKLITIFIRIFTILNIIILPWFIIRGIPMINNLFQLYWSSIR